MATHHLKIDVHTHILPPEWPDLADKYGYGRWVTMLQQHDDHGKCCGGRMLIDGEKFRDVALNCFDHAVRIEECDALGVQAQVLSTVPVMFSYWAKPEHTLEMARHLNDHIAGLCRDHPDRFIGLATLPMQSPDLAVRELERCMNDLGMKGIQIGSHIEQPRTPDWNLSEPALFEVFEACDKLGASVFVHPWDMMGEKDMGQYWLPWLVGMPAETARAICSMIFGGIFDRLPNLRVLFAHGGGSFPYTIGRIEHGYNCRPDLVAQDCKHSPWHYLAQPDRPSKFYVDALVHSRNALRYLIAIMSEQRVAMGSDYPFPLGEQKAGAMIDSMYDLTDVVKRRLLAGTAIEWLNLPDGVFGYEPAPSYTTETAPPGR